ncbi:hypothetical protein VKT23_013265 [Stygiomarasmius scandens]|uniref:F-box domain-containing protein n=1 Tax=Marasmiellus scandens TaxID=2682957 RepID=A0ABR1J7C6_9AGAR
MAVVTPYPFNPSLLTTNTVPDDDDICRVRQICTEHSQDLNRINAQIERLQESLHAITLKRDVLQSQLSSLQSVTSPLRTFPAEILQSVFMHCLELFPIISARESPLLLTQICSRWRSIAIDTPALWTSIHIALVGARHPFESYDSTCNAIRECLQTFLSRSNSLPLNVSLCSGFSPGPYNEDIVREVNRTLEILLRYRRQWKYVNLQLPAQCMDSVEHLKGEDLLNLETAVIDFSGGIVFPPPSQPSWSPFLENTPRLHDLSIGAGDPTVMRKLARGVSWTQLTCLFIGFCYWETSMQHLEDIAYMLKCCDNLEECCITLPGCDLEGFPPTAPKIFLPKLKTITLDCYFPSRIIVFLLDLFVLPELKELTLGANSFHPDLDSDALVISSMIHLIQRSSCLLTQFGLERTALLSTAEHMVSLFKSMPELNTLNLSHTMTESLLQAFSFVSPESENVLCPKLARTEFRDSCSITEPTLVHFLSTRLSPPVPSAITPLNCVVIKDARPSSDSFLSQFGDSVQLNTPWNVDHVHVDQGFRRPTSRVPERLF